MTVVIDASALAELLLARPAAAAVVRHIADHNYDLHAPHLLDVEILSVLRRTVTAGDATPERAAEAVTDLLDLPIERYAHDALAPRIWTLRPNFSAYDATYLALAEVVRDRPVPVLTADARFARAVQTHSEVDVLVV